MRTNQRLKSFFKNADLVTTIATLAFLMGCIFTINAQCPTPPGDPSVYGSNNWIGYVYSGLDSNNPPLNTNTTVVYRGFLTQPEQFNQDLVGAAISGANICGSYADKFFVRYRMTKTFTAGYYTFTIGGDDGERLSFDGGATWAMTDWNYHQYAAITQTFYLDGTKNMVLENYDQGGESRVSIAFALCGSSSTAPTGVSGNTTVCSGSSTTLTATGGIFIAGSSYQWGTGTTVGNSIIAGQTGESISVTPATTTTYWVRRVNPSACGGTTDGITQTVNVTPISSAPTQITGNSNICLGSGTALSASGGTLATGGVYQWGIGTVGSNVITGETAVTINVTPSVNTTYWVRRIDSAPCAGTTAAAIVNVQVNVPSGDQVSYGNDSWIGYVYATIGTANPPADTFTVPYRGYLTQPTTFNQNWGAAALTAPNVCGSYPARFAIRFKMTKNFPAGYYTFTVGGDDGYRLSLDGGSTFAVTAWTDHGYTTTNYTQYLSGSTNLVLEYYEQGGNAQVSFDYATCLTYSSAPTGISGVSSICSGSSTTLTAVGGTMAANATYQWGTGAVGTNIIAQYTASINVNPTSTTTYWVRRLDPAPCNLTSGEATQTVTVSTASTNPTSISTALSTVCAGRTIVLKAEGGTTGTGGVYQWGVGYTAGTNIIAGQTSQTISITASSTTGYWVRRVDPAPCNTNTGGVNTTITVVNPSTAPTTITGVTTICNGGNTNLTASGGTSGGNAVFQWGIGNSAGNNIIAGETNPTIYINPVVSTTYWVRRVDSSPCTVSTAAVYQLVTVAQKSTAPTSVSGSTTICSGTQVNLSAVGGTLVTGGTYQWGTGNVGDNIISGQTTIGYSVIPTTTTTYWVRRIDATPCSTVTNGASITVNVSSASSAPTSISGTTAICASSGGTTLTANGGILGTNAVYQWGTGTVGSNVFGGNQPTQYVNPTVTTNYWVRITNATPCTGNTSAATVAVSVTTRSGNPTSISGPSTVCNGSTVTLTAVGGTVGNNSSYEWGTGYTTGQNIIAGQNAISIAVAPTSQTVYWVRRVDAAPCNLTTSGPTLVVNVTNPSTAPTAITGAGSAACYGTPRTLVADGGSGTVYQWGTGTVGTNVINGQTGSSIVVNPTSTTTYWVRRYDGTPCLAYTSAATTSVSITAPAGNPYAFGVNKWIVYGYHNADLSLTTAVYAGYYIQTTLGFDSSLSFAPATSPSTAANWNGCAMTNDTFTFVQKRRGFPCGEYTITMKNWDDSAELYINGVLEWSCANYSGSATPCPGLVGTYNLNATSTIEVRIRENYGNANAALELINTTVNPTAPTAILSSEPTAVCVGSEVTLTASGGALGSDGEYQWGTGTIGTNIITGETNGSLNITLTENTTYWVRIVNMLCGTFSGGISRNMLINAETVAGTISTPTAAICQGTMPSAITLTGQTGSVVKWQSASDAAFTADVTDIAATTAILSPAQIGIITSTRYFRAVVQSQTCDIKYTNAVEIAISATAIYSNGLWSTPPTATTPVIINSDLTIASDLHVCSCQVNAGVTVTVNENSNFIIETSVTVDPSATFIIEDKGSLVQISDTSIDMGNILVKRNTSPMKQYDYSYWSSPVQGWKLNQLSPLTLSDKYFYYNTAINNWSVLTSGNQIMDAGRGYIVRAPQGWSHTNSTAGVFSATFNGIPNNGVIQTPIQKSPGTYNLIGNPYPSAIDIDAFLTDPANENIITGTVYLWTHNTAVSANTPGIGLYNYTSDDYAKYNLTGSVRTASSAVAGGFRPDGKIVSGQSFFIEANGALASGIYNATFKNSMRVAGSNEHFFRNASNNPSQTPSGTPGDKNRIWVSITNSQGAYNEVLLGYVTGATNGFDNLYDGRTMTSGNVLSMYSIAGTENLSIQGRALPFNDSDILPLGFKTTITGNFTITLDSFDGLFTNQNVFLVDKLNGISHNLKNAPYQFQSAVGTFNTRFEIRFVTGIAKGSSAEIAKNVTVSSKQKQVSIIASSNMTHVEVFDLLGRKIYTSDDFDAFDFTTSTLNSSEQVLIVKIKLQDGSEETRKVIMD